MRVAAIQMESVPGRPYENLEKAEERIRLAAGEGARLIVLPECALNGYDISWFQNGAAGSLPFPDPIFDRISYLSGQLGTAIAFADLEESGEGFYDSELIFDTGVLVSKHRKMTPTSHELESGILAGDRPASPVLLSGTGLAVAPMVCFEYAFPEIALHLAGEGADLIVISSAIRRSFEYLIPVRLRARAQDNACYVVMANAISSEHCGNSMIVNPLGDIVASASQPLAETIFAEIDQAAVEAARPEAAPTKRDHLAVAGKLRKAAPGGAGGG